LRRRQVTPTGIDARASAAWAADARAHKDTRVLALAAAITTAHGLGGVKEPGLERFATALGGGRGGFNDDERAQMVAEGPRAVPRSVWHNMVTARSSRMSRMYEPGRWINRVSLTPLMMVVAARDTMAPVDVALAAYERAYEPKRLQLVPGDHFEPYLARFDIASRAAIDWVSAALS
jgi:fermentation-respiration switch protein FrsA (DUF1100 family)